MFGAAHRRKAGKEARRGTETCTMRDWEAPTDTDPIAISRCDSRSRSSYGLPEPSQLPPFMQTEQRADLAAQPTSRCRSAKQLPATSPACDTSYDEPLAYRLTSHPSLGQSEIDAMHEASLACHALRRQADRMLHVSGETSSVPSLSKMCHGSSLFNDGRLAESSARVAAISEQGHGTKEAPPSARPSINHPPFELGGWHTPLPRAKLPPASSQMSPWQPFHAQGETFTRPSQSCRQKLRRGSSAFHPPRLHHQRSCEEDILESEAHGTRAPAPSCRHSRDVETWNSRERATYRVQRHTRHTEPEYLEDANVRGLERHTGAVGGSRLTTQLSSATVFRV